MGRPRFCCSPSASDAGGAEQAIDRHPIQTSDFVADTVGAKQISQFLDRDTRPDFASTVMIPALQQFIKNPKDIDGLTKSIESQKKSIFTS